MASFSRKRDYEWFERELASREYQNLLRHLQHRNPLFRQFQTWQDLLLFMRAGNADDLRKNAVLVAIFEAHAENQDSRWRTILMTVFFPALVAIHRKKRWWDRYPDELWSTIKWVFLQVVCKVDVKRRPDRLVQKIYNDVVHNLHDEYRRVWDRMARETNVEQEEYEALAGGVEDMGFAEVEFREQQDAEVRRLRKHLEAGRINEADYLLLVGTRVYGKPVVDYAREMKLDYQIIRKRRQRAEAAVRRVEGEKQ